MAGAEVWGGSSPPTQHRIGDPFMTCLILRFQQFFPQFSMFSTGFPGFKRPVANPFAVEAEDPGWGFWPFSPDPGSIG